MRSSQATHRLKLEAAIHLFIGGFTVLLSMSKSSTKSQVITCKGVCVCVCVYIEYYLIQIHKINFCICVYEYGQRWCVGEQESH